MKFLINLTIGIISSLLMTTVFAASKLRGEPLDKIVAVVNESAITQSEVSQTVGMVKQQFAGSQSLPSNEALHKQVLDQLINKKLQMQMAEEAGINVSDEEVDKAIGMIAQQNNVNTDELYKKVVESGLNKTEYRKQIHDGLLLQKVQQQELSSKVTITPQEVDDFMHSKTWASANNKEYHLEDILIALPEAPSPQDLADAKQRADKVLEKIHRGTPFKDAAVADSGDSKALQGGDLGWRKLPEIPLAFSEKLVHMKTNEILGPVQTPNGFHIVLLSGVRNVHSGLNLAEQRRQVEQLIYQRKVEDALQSWLTKLRGNAYVDLHPEV